jgi:hypothetical protein
MDALTHLAHQRLTDLHATADAIRLEREANIASPVAPSDPTPPTEPTPALAVVITECGPCESEAQAA